MGSEKGCNLHRGAFVSLYPTMVLYTVNLPGLCMTLKQWAINYPK